MKSYPILEPVRSTDPGGLVQDFTYWREIASTDSMYEHGEGAIQAAIKLFDGVDRAVEFFVPRFPEITEANISLAVSSAALIMILGDLAHKRFSKKPLADFADEDLLLKYLTHTINEANAAKKFRDASNFHTGETGKILAAVADHLEGRPVEAANSLRETTKKYTTSRILESHLRTRLGKTLSASGCFDDAEGEYDWMAKQSDDLELQTLARREMLNILVQKGWTYYLRKKMPELYELRDKIKILTDDIRDRLGSPDFESKIAGKFKASLKEFCAYNRALDPALDHADRESCLSEIVDSIDELTKEDETTGINRRTQAATLMTRWNQPERAIEYIRARASELDSNVERAAAKLVEGQAQRSAANPLDALSAFRNAEIELEGTTDIRFWRDARRLRLSVEESPSPFLHLGLFARRFSSSDKFNGAFVTSYESG